jgi:hypothetical protein
VVLVGCSSDSDTGPGPGPGPGPDGDTPVDTAAPNPDGTPNPCDLASEADLSAALASAVGEREQAGEGEAQFCLVRAADPQAFASLDLLIEPGGQPLFDALQEQATQSAQFAEIDGVGDAAFRAQADDRGAEISVLQGFYILHISLTTPFSADGAEDRAVALASVIISAM